MPKNTEFHDSPTAAGFYMPAEWEPHDACWMGWPCRTETFGDCQRARTTFAEIARHISQFEPVKMIVRPEDAENARHQLHDCAEILEWPLDDSWLRDIGPSFLRNAKGEIAGVNWRFNAWGEKYSQYDKDDHIATKILTHVGAQQYSAPLIMEGGAFHTDGEGTLLTTEQCLLHPNRNPKLSQEEIETYLRNFTGAEKIVWLVGDLRDNETDGHVDEIACFVAPGVVLAMTDDNDETLSENIRRLCKTIDAKGRQLKIITLPRPNVRENGVFLLASYINFYVANGAVIIPSFGVPEDELARNTLAEAFPTRQIVQIDARAVAFGGGGIHCITQQQPKAVK